jgi:hypothetical protein
MVQRSEGQVSLKIAETISRAIADTGQVTQAELKRLQLGQQLTALQLQLSTLQAEIRALERQRRKTGKERRQLTQLREQERLLIQQIRSIQVALNPELAEQQPVRQQGRRRIPSWLLYLFGGGFLLFGITALCGAFSASDSGESLLICAVPMILIGIGLCVAGWRMGRSG